MNPFAPFLYAAMGASMLSALCVAWPLALLNDPPQKPRRRVALPREREEQPERTLPKLTLVRSDNDL